MKNFLYPILFNIFKLFLKISPQFLIDLKSKILINLLLLVDKKHQKIINTNLDFAYNNKLSNEEKKSIINRCYFNMVHFFIDFINNQNISKEELNNKITTKNAHYLEDAKKENKKIIIITAHYGNWELISLYIGANYGKLAVVGKPLKEESMQNILQKNREQFNIELIDKKGAMKPLISALKKDTMVGVLVDQNQATIDGVLVDFFGKQSRHTTVASMLARRFDAVIIPAFISSDDYKHHQIEFFEPIVCQNSDDKNADIQNCTQKQASITEKVIKQNPKEWFWFHKRWKNMYEDIYS
jgi:KDO2-lipid IV(A) lauroyltransferase